MNMTLAIVEWEDIVGVTHQTLPQCDSDLEPWKLVKQTIGYVIEFANYLVVVTDYDVTHQGEGYRHNDYTKIPKGVVLSVHNLEEIGAGDPGPNVVVEVVEITKEPAFDKDLPTDDTVMRD